MSTLQCLGLGILAIVTLVSVGDLALWLRGRTHESTHALTTARHKWDRMPMGPDDHPR